MVLVDASHPDLLERTPAEAIDSATPIPRWQMRVAAHFGIARLMLEASYPRIDPDDPVSIRLHKNGQRSLDGLYNEMETLESTIAEASTVSDIGDIPLLVVSANDPERFADYYQSEQLREEMDRLWQELQIDLLSLSSNSRQILAHKSGHYVQLEQPELLADAIRFLVDCTTGAKGASHSRKKSRIPIEEKQACDLMLM